MVKTIKVKESTLLNQPLNSSEQGKLILFAWLMAPSVVLLAGVIPTMFLAFGIYMMKKNQDFSSIDTAVKNFKAYVWLSLIVGIGDSIYWLFEPLFWGGYYDGEISIWFLISLLGVVTPIIYLNVVNNLFYTPLKEHSEWVAVNGIFSTKPKSDTKSAIEPEVDIIKGEKLKTTKDKDIGAIDSKADALLKWNELLTKGAITQEEYDKAKRDLLG